MNFPDLRLFHVFLIVFSCLILPGTRAVAGPPPGTAPTVEVYPAAPGIAVSSQYSVTIVQNGATYNSPVYQIQNPAFLPNGQPSGIVTSSTREQTTAWTTFSTNVPVTVQVSNARPFQSVRILPSHARIVPAVNGSVVRFVMSNGGHQQVSVDFCYTSATCDDSTDTDIANPLLVFVNVLQSAPAADALIAQPGGAVPPLDGQSMIYFGPGVYDLGQTPYTLGSNQTALLAGGAYVKGMFALADGSSGAAVKGRGILSGENVPRSSCPPPRNLCPQMVGGTKIAGGATIEGITMIDAPFYNVLLGGAQNAVHNIKILSWYGNNDAISVAGNADIGGSSIRDSFFKTGDDAIKLFSNNLVVSDCTVWQLNNAAPFELGVNLSADVSHVTVENSDVIRTETQFANRSNAVFSAALGGNANVSDYRFRHIRVENSDYQLFKFAVIPNAYTQPGNDSLGSISRLTFDDIRVTDPQTLPNLFQSFDREHQVSDITFAGVFVAGQELPGPNYSINANRNLSLGGTAFSSLLWRSENQPQTFQIALFAGATGSPPTSTISLTDAKLDALFRVQAVGDFYGDGAASVLFRQGATGALGIWKDPALTGAAPSEGHYFPVEPAPSAATTVAGVGDFNGDGRSDILLWNAASETGTILLMDGSHVVGQLDARPAKASDWTVAGVADITETGFSDIVLRDGAGNVEILFFGAAGLTGSVDYAPGNLFYNSTANYNTQFPALSGHFDATWSIAGIRDFNGNGYAEILWVDAAGDLGLTSFAFADPKVQSGQVFARLPAGSEIAALGDYNGDETADILLRDPASGALTIWYTGYNGGNLYLPGPTFAGVAGSTLQ
jgi:hypothetical protein